MNKLVIATLAVLAVASYTNGFLFDDNDGSRFAESFAGRDFLSAGDRSSLSSANRLRDSAAGKSLSADRANLAAKSANGERLAYANKQAGEEYLSQNDMVEFAADDMLSDKSRFALNLQDDKAHDEGSNVAYRKANAIDKGSKFAVDQVYDSEVFDNKQVAAEVEKVDEEEAQKETAVEDLLDEKAEATVDEGTEIKHEIIAEALNGGIGDVSSKIFGGSSSSSIFGNSFGRKYFKRR